MASNENVTALLYRRRNAPAPDAHSMRLRERPMAFDPLLTFTAVLVGGAAISQLVFLLLMEF